MESVRDKMRYKLVLGKFPVHRVHPWAGGFQFCLDLLNGCKLVVDVPAHCDVKEGDLLTIYTEVYADANSKSAPVQ